MLDTLLELKNTLYAEWKDILSSFLVMFAIINILGNTPVVLRLEQDGAKVSPSKASALAIFMMFSFLYIGEGLLHLFGLTLPAFAVAGSFVIFVLALQMILDIPFFSNYEGLKSDITFFPVVFPMLIGPGALTTILALRAQYATEIIWIAIAANALIIYICLRLTHWLGRVLGQASIYALQKFFGVVRLAIAVKIFTTNITVLLKQIQ